MKIYTKGGDQGETGLFGGSRVSKDHGRIETYGTMDELNACLGVAISLKLPSEVQTRILRIQGELFQLGAELATPVGRKYASKLIDQADIVKLEKEIDEMESKLSPLKTFILPGGTQAASQIHFARCVCRRAERLLVTLTKSEQIRPEAIQYLNRLSDYLFVTARYLNFLSGVTDVPWLSP